MTNTKEIVKILRCCNPNYYIELLIGNEKKTETYNKITLLTEREPDELINYIKIFPYKYDQFSWEDYVVGGKITVHTFLCYIKKHLNNKEKVRILPKKFTFWEEKGKVTFRKYWY